jgi:hypothetical protein
MSKTAAPGRRGDRAPHLALDVLGGQPDENAPSCHQSPWPPMAKLPPVEPFDSASSP